jgi:hypothetical protein
LVQHGSTWFNNMVQHTPDRIAEPHIHPQAPEATLNLRGVQGTTAVFVDGFEETWRCKAAQNYGFEP